MAVRTKKALTNKGGKFHWNVKRVSPTGRMSSPAALRNANNNNISDNGYTTPSGQRPASVKKEEEQMEIDLYRAISVYLLIAQIFICAPLGVHRRRRRPEDKPFNSLPMLLHLMWCCTVYTIISIVVYLEYTNSVTDLPTVQQPLFYAEYFVYFVHIFVVMAATYCGRENFRRFPAILLDFDRQLLQWRIPPDYGEIANFCRAHFFLIFVHFTLTAITNYYYSGERLLPFLNSVTVYMLPNMILEISLVQLYTLLYAIAQRSERLNRALQHQLDLAKKSRDGISHGDDGDCSATLQNQFQSIRVFYSKLELFTNTVNEAFAPSVVLVYVGSFANLTVNLFLLYKFVDDAGGSDWSEIMYSVIWTFMHIAKMCLILRYNHVIQEQKKDTALLLNEVKGQNAAMEATITHFILQLIINTRSNVVCGVAVLNMEFITSLLVAISTLFIFLLQYDITFEALSKSHQTAVLPTHSI